MQAEPLRSATRERSGISLTLFDLHGPERDRWRAEPPSTGTVPIQNERYCAAFKGNGAEVREIQLPAEAHRYRAHESIGQTLAATVRCCDA